MTQRLVLHTNNLNYTETPRLGLTSLLVELGVPDSESIIEAVGYFIDYPSIYSLINLYRFIGDNGVMIASSAILIAYNVYYNESIISSLKSRSPQFTNGWSYIESQLKIINSENLSFINWLGYPTISLETIRFDPMSYLIWLDGIAPELQEFNTAIREGSMTNLITELVKIKLNINITTLFNWGIYQRWIALGFNKGVFGSNPEQGGLV